MVERILSADMMKEILEELDKHNLRPERTRGPWWATAIGQVGPTVVVLFVLLGMLTGIVPSPFTKLTRMDDSLTELIKSSKEQARVSRVICRNVAKSDAARELCDER